jgi:hypothetical protein
MVGDWQSNPFNNQVMYYWLLFSHGLSALKPYTRRVPGEHNPCPGNEWLGCRTLNQRVVGSNPGEGAAWHL